MTRKGKTMFIELKQKHVEAFSKELPDTKTTTVVVYSGAVVRAAAKAGWFATPIDPDSVDDMKPSEVKTLAEAVIKAYAESMGVSPS